MWNDFMRSLLEEEADSTKSAVETVDGKEVGSPVRNVDADTLAVQNQRYRLKGFNAPETAKFQGGVFVPGQVAGDRTQENVNKAAQEGGYTNLVTTGKVDPYGRKVASQQDSAGNDLGDMVTALGLTEMTPFSELGAVAENGVIRALSRIMPSMAEADPMIREARAEHERRVRDAGGNPLYIPKLVMNDEAQYAAAKNMVGIAAVKEQIEEIDRIEGYLKNPNLDPPAKAKLTTMLEDAKDKLFFAGTTPDFAGSVVMRKGDRTIMNQAKDQFTTSFNRSIIDLKKGLYGYMEMAGNGQGWEWLEKKGREGVLTQKVISGNLPDTLSSIRDIDTSGDTWDTITDAATYAGNLIAGTLPMMGVMIGSAAAAGMVAPTAAVALGASMLPSSVLYSGQFYADQPDDKKNSALALSFGIGAAVLDRVGLEGMMKGGNIFSAAGRKEAADLMVQTGKTGSVEEAEKLLKDATKKEIMAMTGAGAEFATKMYASKEAQLAAIRSIGVASAGEAVTESGQTLLEMFAVSGELDPNLKYEKHFYTALVDAAIGGGLMGGAFHAGGTAVDIAQWGSAANAKKEYEGKVNDALAFQAQQKALAEAGVPAGNPQGVTSVLQAITKVNNVNTAGPTPDLMSMSGRPGYWNGFLSVVKDPVRLLRSLADTTVRSLRKSDGTLKFYLPVLKSIMSPGILPGDAYDGFRQRIIGEWNTTDAETLATELKVPVARASSLLKEAWQSTWSSGKRLTPDSPQNITLQAWKDEADQITAQAGQLLAELGYDTTNFGGQDSVFVDAAVDPKEIAKNENRLVATMVRNGSGVREAREAVQGLISGNPAVASSSKHWMESHGVFQDQSLNDLFEPNIFAAFENYKHRIASQAANQLYLGER